MGRYSAATAAAAQALRRQFSRTDAPTCRRLFTAHSDKKLLPMSREEWVQSTIQSAKTDAPTCKRLFTTHSDKKPLPMSREEWVQSTIQSANLHKMNKFSLRLIALTPAMMVTGGFLLYLGSKAVDPDAILKRKVVGLAHDKDVQEMLKSLARYFGKKFLDYLNPLSGNKTEPIQYPALNRACMASDAAAFCFGAMIQMKLCSYAMTEDELLMALGIIGFNQEKTTSCLNLVLELGIFTKDYRDSPPTLKFTEQIFQEFLSGVLKWRISGLLEERWEAQIRAQTDHGKASSKGSVAGDGLKCPS